MVWVTAEHCSGVDNGAVPTADRTLREGGQQTLRAQPQSCTRFFDRPPPPPPPTTTVSGVDHIWR